MENTKTFIGKVWNKSRIKLLVGIWRIDADGDPRVIYKWTLQPGEQQPCALQPGEYLVTWCDGKKNCKNMWIFIPENIIPKPDGDFLIWFGSGGEEA